MTHSIEIPTRYGSILLLVGCLALSACNRSEAPPGAEVSPVAREAASGADAIAVPPATQGAEPTAASAPQSSASPAPSAADTATAPATETAGGSAPTADAGSTAGGTVTPAAAPSADDTAPSAPAAAGASPAGGSDARPYQVVDGYKVDAATMEGFRAWRAAACDRCHGANQEGMVGPSLIASLKTLSKEDFITTVRDGRLQKGMQSFGNNKQVMDNMDGLYAYLKGRSDGAITRAKVEPMK